MSMAPSEAWPGPSWGKSCVHIDQLIHRYVESHYIDNFFMLTTPVRCSSAIERLKHCWSVGTPGTFLECCVIYLIVATYFLTHLTIGRCLFFAGMVHAWEVLDITWHCIRQMDFQVLAAVVVHILFPLPLGAKGSFVLLKQRPPDFAILFFPVKHNSTSCQCWLALNCQVIAYKTSEMLL